MSQAFDANQGLVIVNAELIGPAATAVLRLALDTGATSTLINTALLVSAGYDPFASPDRVEIITGSGVEYSSRVKVDKLVALGTERLDFSVLAHTLPSSAGVDGLLGLDFVRGRFLTLDFIAGRAQLD
jgi:predicted aspartyl protease